MRATRMAAILAACCLIPTAVSAQEVDFTFTVPVEVELLHSSMLQPSVLCWALTNTNEVVGSRLEPIPVDAQGSYSGDLVVELNNTNGIPASDATQYRCALWFRINGQPRTSMHNSYPQGVRDDAQPKEGTSPTLLVEGTLP